MLLNMYKVYGTYVVGETVLLGSYLSFQVFPGFKPQLLFAQANSQQTTLKEEVTLPGTKSRLVIKAVASPIANSSPAMQVNCLCSALSALCHTAWCCAMSDDVLCLWPKSLMCFVRIHEVANCIGPHKSICISYYYMHANSHGHFQMTVSQVTVSFVSAHFLYFCN